MKKRLMIVIQKQVKEITNCKDTTTNNFTQYELETRGYLGSIWWPGSIVDCQVSHIGCVMLTSILATTAHSKQPSNKYILNRHIVLTSSHIP